MGLEPVVKPVSPGPAGSLKVAMIVSLAPACPAVCLQVRSRNAQLESVAEHPLPVSRIAEWDTRRRHLSFRGNLGKSAEGLQELALSSDSGLRRTADLLPGKVFSFSVGNLYLSTLWKTQGRIRRK